MSEAEMAMTIERLKRCIQNLGKLRELTYTNPRGIKFLFCDDVEKVLSPEQFKKYREMSVGSTIMFVSNNIPVVYLEDIEKFLRLDAEGR